MKRKPKKSTGVDYETLASTYQVVEVALLNQVLKAHGILDKRKRRKICESYFFDQSVIMDYGAFQTEPDGKWYMPTPCFAEAEGNPDDGFGRTRKLYRFTDDFTGFHEYALGNVREHFVEC